MGGVKVTFNSGVRYSQWAINSRLHDFYGNQKKFGFDYYDNNGTLTKGVTWYKLDGKTEVTRSFDYVAGLVGKASLEAADFYENFEWSKPWFYAAQGYATGTRYANKNMTLDNMNAAKMYFPILAGNLKSQEATTTANTAINAVINDMKTYNSTYVIGSENSALNNTNANDVQKSMFGGWFHKSTEYTDQMWCDGQYMGPALLAQIIKHTGKTNNISDNDWDIIAKQFSITWAQLYDKTTGLLYHGFTANPGDDASTSWAGISKENGIYHSASFWGRANAWYFLALVDFLEVMPTDNVYYNTFKGYLTSLAEGIKKYQDDTTGCWYQVMDKVPASLTGNYLEASCSSIFTAGYLKAIRLGLLDKTTYEPIAKKAYEGLVNQFMVYDNKDNSTIQLVHSCTSAGLGGSNKRAGDDNYYLTGKDASVVTSSDPTSQYYYTEGKVLGGFIMAATEYERAYQNQDSKQILFARDLAPSYDFTTTAGTLDATAYGSGDVTYQWYKDGNAIANAKSATYAPRVSGSYYCIAKSATNSRSAGGNTIQTSTTTVTIANTDNGSTTVTESEVIYNFTTSTSVGTTTDGINCTSTNGIIKFSSDFSAKDGKYITIKPKTGGFKAGDVITLKGYCDSKNLSGVIIYSDVNGSSIFKSNILATSAAGGSEFTYTIEKDCDALYLGRYGGGTTYLASLKVERPASSSGKTRLTASFERNADVVVNTTKTATLPTLTVKVGEATLTANKDYTVVYKSNAENVATLSDNNTITIKSLGIATITATVTPKYANTYEGTTATYQLSVKAPSPLNVSVMDVTINTTDAEEEQPVIKVYGDNDKLLKLGQDYTLSYTVSGDNNVTVDETTGKFSVNKNAENTAFVKGTSLITVTATPTTSLGSNYTEGKLQFSYSVSEGKIKPVFLESFKGITINLHQDSNNRTITVPLIHDGEDVSSYFIYTYTITPTGNTSSVTGSTLNFTPETAGTYSVKVSAKPDPNGTNDYSDVYDNPDAITFTLSVDSKNQTISVTPDPTSIKMDAGTTQGAPDLTVTTENTTLADTEYNTLWFSTSPGIVKVDAKTGKIEAVSEGTAKIRVVVTGENLESTTALITVEVDDPAMYRVKGPGIGETYGNPTRMWNQDKNMSVVLGGWLFSDDVKKIVATPNTSKEGLSAGYYWGPGATKAKWKLTGFDYYVAGDNNKNARQENGSNALPETTYIYSADFVKYKGTIKDNMFNVPCSGSYLEFNPVTNGKVTVHIFQNGAFDAKTEKDNTKIYQYRPQRRVFVMDEAGNFVESTAHIESTNGKPTGGIQKIGKYTWDLDSKTLTIGDVRSHFKGIPDTFDMTAEAFKNNVYESLLDTKKVPNAAANDRKGSHGWSVLADSPVTYTFNVKAGKTYYLYNFGSKIGFYGFSFDEGETKPTVDEFTFNDDKTNTITATEAGHVAKVTVNRKMTKGIWTTCVLPFSLNRQQVDAIFGPAYSAAYPQGTQILYFDRVEGNKVYFVRHAYNTIVAGKPFLIKPTKDVTSINTAEVTDYPYVTIENTEPANWCSDNYYTWASSYSYGMTVKEGDGFISKDGLFKNFVGKDGTLKGFRGYLKRLDTQTGAKPIMLQVVNSSNVDGDNGETTGIEDLIIDADGQLMPANGKVYNINGQLVSEDANSFQSLPSGIYIINGKKYIK